MLLYEINARVNGQRFASFSENQFGAWRALGFDAVWLMGVWELSPEGIRRSRRVASDFEGSPYAIPQYRFNPDLGDDETFVAMRRRAQAQGVKLILDFVPNHMARDTPLIDAHPEYFIHSNRSMRDEYDDDYYLHPSGRRLAHGKDPYFAGWNDTVQLDYTVAGLRRHMCEVLKRLATVCDGVRCDMAMLLLRDQIRRQWYPHLPYDAFAAAMPGEFWDEAISETKKVNPGFLFIAEAYWDTEPKLRELGFDYTYHKSLFDQLGLERPAPAVNAHLRQASERFLGHSLHFIENHDEERAAARLSPLAARRAAALACLLPGATLIHQGQMEGMTEKLPVQRVRPLHAHRPDDELLEYYRTLLHVAQEPLFREGRYVFAESNCPDMTCFWRAHGRVAELVAIPLGAGPADAPESVHVSAPPAAFEITAGAAQSGWDKGKSVAVEPREGYWEISAAEIARARGPADVVRLRFARR
jgi:hypothetical protein